MTEKLSAVQLAASGMRSQSERLRHISENIANADTPGYHRKTVSFQQVMDGQGVAAGKPRLDKSDLARIYDPGHPLADDTGHYGGSNVDLVIEIADSREANRSYEANLRVFEQSRQMSSSLLDLIRR